MVLLPAYLNALKMKIVIIVISYLHAPAVSYQESMAKIIHFPLGPIRGLIHTVTTLPGKTVCIN